MRFSIALFLSLVFLVTPCLSNVLFKPGEMLEGWSLNTDSYEIADGKYQNIVLDGPKGASLRLNIKSTAVQESSKRDFKGNENFKMSTLRFEDHKGWFARGKFRDAKNRSFHKYVFYLDTKQSKSGLAWVQGVLLTKKASVKNLKAVLGSIVILD